MTYRRSNNIDLNVMPVLTADQIKSSEWCQVSELVKKAKLQPGHVTKIVNIFKNEAARGLVVIKNAKGEYLRYCYFIPTACAKKIIDYVSENGNLIGVSAALAENAKKNETPAPKGDPAEKPEKSAKAEILEALEFERKFYKDSIDYLQEEIEAKLIAKGERLQTLAKIETAISIVNSLFPGKKV